MENRKKITYRSVGGYRLPNLLPNQHPKVMLGSYARERRKYLMENCRATYATLLTSGQLTEHLVQTEQRATELEQTLTEQMTQTESLTERLKQRPEQSEGNRDGVGDLRLEDYDRENEDTRLRHLEQFCVKASPIRRWPARQAGIGISSCLPVSPVTAAVCAPWREYRRRRRGKLTGEEITGLNRLPITE